MKKLSILKTPNSKFALIFTFTFALLSTITISCTNNLTETSPESSYDYILGEYQTSLGKLVITSTENYILTYRRKYATCNRYKIQLQRNF